MKITILALTTLWFGRSLDAPCYGFGSNFGINSYEMENDYQRASSFIVGSTNMTMAPSYLRSIKFFFEGKVGLMAQYSQVNNPNKTKDGWSHGSEVNDLNYGNWTAYGANSIIGEPVAYFDASSGTLSAFSFKELLFPYASTIPKVQ